MSIIARGTSKSVPINYPPGCKEATEELGKDELVRRLKLIARAFQDMGQDDNEQYTGLALHLASDFFLEHNNKDVRLLVACCIADLFRIFAPEAPYRDAAHLKDIFMFLIKQLRGLEDPNSPTFKRYFYLLENLAWVKSFNICIELDDNQEIFCSLFKLMFSIINEKHTAKVKNFMLDMMSPLLTEADNVSQELLDILLLNIVEPHKTQNRQAYSLAKELLMRTSNAIEQFVQAFFNNTLMLGKTSESELSEHLYDLIYELNTICPSVLLAVLPQLEFKLKSNEENERKAVTKILSKMFADSNSNLAELNKPLWTCYLGRFNDISITVRTVCVQSAQAFVLHHPDLVKDVVEQVKSRQHDAEETVRFEVVNTLLMIAKRNFDLMTEDMLDVLKERTRDRKFKIRRDALQGLGQLYKQVMSPDNTDLAQINKIKWVKDKVFHAYYQQNPDDRLLVERLFNICLVPYTLPVQERMKRLYQLYATLDEPAVKAFNEMMKHRNMVRQNVKYVIDGIERLSAKPSEQVAFLPKLQQIARTLPDPHKTIDHLKKLNDLMKTDRRLRSLFKYLVSPECTCRRANDNVREILKKFGAGSSSTSPGQMMIYNTIKSLLERVAPVMVDSQAIETLLGHIKDAVRGVGTVADGIVDAGEKGAQLLLCLSSVFPQYFQSEETFETLISFLKDEDEVVADTTLQIVTNCGQDLEKQNPELFAKLLPILQHTAKIGNPKQAKHAIRCMYKIAENKEVIFSQVFEHAKNNINPDSANYITSIVALGHISMLCPEEFGQSMKTIVSKDIVKDLLMQDRTHGSHVMDSWYSDHLVTEETQAKIQAMKLLMRWLLGLKSNTNNSCTSTQCLTYYCKVTPLDSLTRKIQAMKLLMRWLLGLKSNTNNSCTSTLRLLYTVIVHEGDLMEKGLINKPELARLRLQAGCCLLRLCEETIFADLLQREQFQALALLINDSCYHVRLKFANKLHKGLYALKLPLEFMSIFSLAANDPLRERRTNIKKFIQMNIQRRRDYLKQNPGLGGRMFHYLPDYAMPYTIHLLAHDPDLKSYEDLQALKNIKECLWFIMEPLVARSEDYNYHFFRRMIENIKTTKDAQGEDDEEMNKKLYAVCDVAIGLLQKNCTVIVLKETNVDPVLPSKLFTKPEKEIVNTQLYLPKDFNFEKKKNVMDPIPPIQSAAIPLHPVPFRKKKPVEQTLETIIVESPGPVVNPNPTCPKESRHRPGKKDKKNDDTQSEITESPTSEEGETKKATRSRRKVSDEQKKADEEAESENTAPVKKKGKGRGKKVTETGDNNESESQDTVGTQEDSAKESESVNTVQEKKKGRGRGGKKVGDKIENESQETIETSQELVEGGEEGMEEEGNEEDSVETEETETPSPPKKRLLKRTLNQAKSQPAKSVKGKNVSDTKVKGKGKDTLNGSQKGTKRKTDQEEGETEETGSETSPQKKRRFNLEKDAVPAPKIGRGKRKQQVRSDSESSVSGESGTQGDEESGSFKSPAPKSKSLPSPKKSSKAETPSPASSRRSSSGSSTPVSQGKKTAVGKQTKGPKLTATATAKAKNVRRAKTLSNGTSSESESSPKKAEALLQAISKGNLGKKAKKPAAKGKKK